jgi:hypothetical protein
MRMIFYITLTSLQDTPQIDGSWPPGSHRRLRSVTDAVCGERTRRRADRLRRHHSGDDERSYESPQQARAGPNRRGRDGHLTDIRRNQRRHDDLAK